MSKNFFICPFLILVIGVTYSKSLDGKCRALALRGGGTKGAYEAGFLKAMLNYEDPIEYSYDVVSGVSVGSMNGAMYSVYDYGEEKEAIEKMLEIWTTLLPQDFWDYWPYVNVLGVLYYQSFLDSTKLR